VRDHQYVAIEELDRRLAADAHPARSLCDDMVGNDVLGPRKDDLGEGAGLRHLHRPGGRRIDAEEQRAGKLYRPQDV
jgi:hypothetical protein